ncbi:MAG: GNAT family N-acetyltransferase [Alphaproteobacteria bacterium]
MATIRPATDDDWPGIWAIFRAVVRAGDTYPYPTDTSESEAKKIWIETPLATYVADDDGRVIGTYYLKPNQPGRGGHVCNAGYMVDAGMRGQGLGRTMCAHSMDEARRLGFTAMQYNLVVASNEAAVRLWQDMGFGIIGRLPRAFDHETKGLTDALLMYRQL